MENFTLDVVKVLLDKAAQMPMANEALVFAQAACVTAQALEIIAKIKDQF